MQVILIGQASGLTKHIAYTEADLHKTLLDFLTEKGVTIASSCSAQGICKKCTIQSDWLTCKLTLNEFLERQLDGKIFVGYL